MAKNENQRHASGGRRARLGELWSTLVGADSTLGRVAWQRPHEGPGSRRRTDNLHGPLLPLPESFVERGSWSGLLTVLAVIAIAAGLVLVLL